VSKAARAERDAIAEALKPRGCGSCGLTMGSASAWTVHFEHGPGSRCLPPGARGQLAEVDGVWCTRGSEPN
jgi:hypothetical protein